MKCPRCNGDGQVEETINSGDGMSPDRDVPVICHICEGKGIVPDDFEDWDEYDYSEDDSIAMKPTDE